MGTVSLVGENGWEGGGGGKTQLVSSAQLWEKSSPVAQRISFPVARKTALAAAKLRPERAGKQALRSFCL